MAKQKFYTKTLTLPDGTRKYFRGKTKDVVDKKLLLAKMQLQNGVDISDNTTVAELAQMWYDAFKKDQLHTRSLEDIKGTLNRYVLPEIGELLVRDVRPLHIQRMMKSVSHLSQSVQRKVLQRTKAVFQLGVDNGLISRSPVTSNIKAKGAPPEPETALTQEQTDDLLLSVRDTRAYPFVLLCLYAGLRRGEAVGVKWEDFDFARGTLTVSRSVVFTVGNRAGEVNEEMKTRAAHRTIPLPLPVLSYFSKLKAQEEGKSEWVLHMEDGRHLSDCSFNSMWGLVRRRSTIENPDTNLPFTYDFTTHPHQFRHTCITRWVEAGLDIKEVQYLAGHTTVELTLNIYTHYNAEAQREATAEKIRAAASESVAL